MPRFFIDTSDEDRLFLDEAGSEFADLAAAKTAAIDALPDMARDVLPDGDRRVFLAIVRDARGRNVLEASLTLRVKGGDESPA